MAQVSIKHDPGPTRHLGRYRLLLELGHGGMGTIHLGVATGTGDFHKLVVLKELREERSNDVAFVDMFMREAMLAGRLNHANIVQTIEAAQDGKRLFLAMEFLDGQPLLRVLQNARQEPVASTRLMLHLLCQVLAGLHYAHELTDYGGSALDIVHCDMCPHNVFITYDGHVKVVDFGIARASDSGSTETGFRGRLAYAAPEQVLGKQLDRRVDIFAVGVMLWEMLAHQRFVPRGTPQEDIIFARVSGEEKKLTDVAPTVSPALVQICEKALRVDPAERFATAEEFRLALYEQLKRMGGPIDTGTVATLMTTKFAEHRSALHTLIHDAISEETTFIKRQGLILDPQLGNDEVTRVADLSSLVEMTRSDKDLEVVPDFHSKNRYWAAVAVGVLSIGALGWALLSGGPEQTPAESPADLPLASLPGPDVETTSEVAATTTAASDAPPNAKTETNTVAEALQPAAEDAPEERGQEATGDSKPTKAAPRWPRTSKRPVSGTDELDATEDSTPDTVSPAPVKTSSGASSAPSKPKPTAGDEMSRPERKRRNLDVDNPFR